MPELGPGRLIAGKYRLLERVSDGGMGSLWRAQHLQLDAPVAMKFMHRSMLDVQGARARFEREAKAAAQLRSPCVIHTYDHGIDEETGMPFIAMELLDGEDLSSRLRRDKQLSPQLVVRICQSVCKGLQKAHDAGIVHRDMKPANIFLCAPKDEEIKILDFGIAKRTESQPVVDDDETSARGQILGSPQYMSPEQAQGQQLDGRTDLWALAVVLYRSLTGKRPFDGKRTADILVRICTEPVPPPSTITPRLGPDVDLFFARAFQRDRDNRFQSAESFNAAFEAALAGTVGYTAQSRANAARIVRPQRIPHEEEKKAGGLRSARISITIGAVIAGSIILLTWVKPGELTPTVVWETIRYAVGAFGEAAKGESAEADSAASASATPEQVAEKAWLKTYKLVRMNEIPLAVASLPDLLEVYPNAPIEKRNTFLLLAERAFARKDAVSDDMGKLLSAGMGAHGPDLLFDLVVTRRETPAAKAAIQLLGNTEVRQRGSKDMLLAYAIRKAAACAKKPHILRAKADGGFRTLREIKELTADCERRQRCCLRGDAAVAAVETAIQSRL